MCPKHVSKTCAKNMCQKHVSKTCVQNMCQIHVPKTCVKNMCHSNNTNSSQQCDFGRTRIISLSHTSWVTLPGSHFLGHTSWVTLPGSHFIGYTSWATLPGSHFLGHTSRVTLPGSHFLGHTYWVTLPGSQLHNSDTGHTEYLPISNSFPFYFSDWSTWFWLAFCADLSCNL